MSAVYLFDFGEKGLNDGFQLRYSVLVNEFKSISVVVAVLVVDVSVVVVEDETKVVNTSSSLQKFVLQVRQQTRVLLKLITLSYELWTYLLLSRRYSSEINGSLLVKFEHPSSTDNSSLIVLLSRSSSEDDFYI